MPITYDAATDTIREMVGRIVQPPVHINYNCAGAPVVRWGEALAEQVARLRPVTGDARAEIPAGEPLTEGWAKASKKWHYYRPNAEGIHHSACDRYILGNPADLGKEALQGADICKVCEDKLMVIGPAANLEHSVIDTILAAPRISDPDLAAAGLE